MKTVILLISILANQAHASYNQRAQTLIKAKNPHHLRKDLQNQDQAELLKKSCELELLEQKVPSDCYQWIAQQKKSKKITKEEFQEKKEEYNQACEESVSNSKTVLEVKGLSSECALLVRERNKEVRYSD